MIRSFFGNSNRKLRSTFWGSPFIPVGTNQTECWLSFTNLSVPERAWKSPHARKARRGRVLFTRARVSLTLLFLRKMGTTRSLTLRRRFAPRKKDFETEKPSGLQSVRDLSNKTFAELFARGPLLFRINRNKVKSSILNFDLRNTGE